MLDKDHMILPETVRKVRKPRTKNAKDLAKQEITNNKRAMTNAIVHGKGLTQESNRWLVERASEEFDFSSNVMTLDDNKDYMIDGLELTLIPDIINDLYNDEIPF